MSYRRFKFVETDFPPATLATFATVRAFEPPNVASVANVAGQNQNPAILETQNVANVASVAGQQASSEFPNSQAAVRLDAEQAGEGDGAGSGLSPATLATNATLPNGTVQSAANVACDRHIPCKEVRAAFDVAADRFAFLRGLPRAQAEASALALVRGELLNGPRLVPEQRNVWRCLVCGEAEMASNPLVPVLTTVEDRPLWLHLEGCHAEYLKHRAKEVDALLAAALGPDHESARP